MPSLDDEIEDKTDNTPGCVTNISCCLKVGDPLDSSCRGNVCRSREKDGGIEKLPGSAGVSSCQKVDGDWCDGANQKEKQV